MGQYIRLLSDSLVGIQGNRTEMCYQDERLGKHGVPFMAALQDIETFQHDNALTHVYGMSMHYFCADFRHTGHGLASKISSP